MKKFDIEKAKAGKPVCTKDGKPVRIISFDRNHPEYPIVALVCNKALEIEEVYSYTEKGEIVGDDNNYYEDLIMAPEKYIAWVNVYKNYLGSLELGKSHETEEEARENIDKTDYREYLKTIKIEWEE